MKTNQTLVSLCTVAVVTVTGCASVESASSIHAHASTSSPQSNASNSSQKTTQTSKSTVKSTQESSSKKQTVVKQKYKDGTYTGVGETRIGAVQVSVTLKKDKITDVKITGYSTHYPISYIDPVLPQELLQRQDVSKIDVVSGATLSTYDFYYAVQEALTKAQYKS